MSAECAELSLHVYVDSEGRVTPLAKHRQRHGSSKSMLDVGIQTGWSRSARVSSKWKRKFVCSIYVHSGGTFMQIMAYRYRSIAVPLVCTGLYAYQYTRFFVKRVQQGRGNCIDESCSQAHRTTHANTSFYTVMKYF